MLTGDKVETAINIGIATGLIDSDGTQFIYQWDMLEEKTSRTSTAAPSQSPDFSGRVSSAARDVKPTSREDDAHRAKTELTVELHQQSRSEMLASQ